MVLTDKKTDLFISAQVEKRDLLDESG